MIRSNVDVFRERNESKAVFILIQSGDTLTFLFWKITTHALPVRFGTRYIHEVQPHSQSCRQTINTMPTIINQPIVYARQFARWAMVFQIFAVLSLQAGEKARRPNIVFILADDMGWTDLGVQGSKFYESPQIDKLAAQSCQFQNHHHCQNCVPTRSALWSGQYASRTGIYTVGSLERGESSDRKLNVPENLTQLPLDRKTIGDQLKSAGYRTGYFGKWHLGQNGDYHPSRRGWDQAITSMGKHYDFVTQPPVPHDKSDYLADWLTDRALGFINQNKDDPFFLVLAHFAVHTPLQAKPEKIKQFENKKPTTGGHTNVTYAAMIASLDESVGRVLKRLDELQLSDDTIVIFTSDNGGVGGYGDRANNVTDNAPLRDGKGSHYEGGLRVPMFVKWPGVTKAGAISREPTTHVDFYPTILEMAGAQRPDQILDGLSLTTLMKSNEPATARLERNSIFAHLPGYLQGRNGQWRTTPVSTIIQREFKLMEYLEDGRMELYDLQNDPSEKHNLAKDKPDTAKRMQLELAQWRKSTRAAMPTPNPDYGKPIRSTKKQALKKAARSQENDQ